MADLARIKNNVRKMVAQDAPESDIDAYIASEGVTIDDVRAFRPDDVTDPTPSERVSAGFAAVPEGEVVEQQPQTRRGIFLPLERNFETGELSLAVPEVIRGIPGAVREAAEDISEAVRLPGDVYAGRTQLRDPVTGDFTVEATDVARDLASLALPGTPQVAKGVSAAARPVPSPRQLALEAAERQGVEVPRAVGGTRLSQAAGQYAANAPFAGEPVRRGARRAVGQMDEVVQQAAEIGRQSPAVAGRRAAEDIAEFSRRKLQTRVDRAYDKIGDMVQPFVRSPLRSTAKTVAEITGKREAGAIPGKSSALGMVEKALGREGGLTYEGIKSLRTRVGEMLDNPNLIPADTSQAELKRIYGALSDDLRAAARAAGGRPALREFNRANALAARVAREREELQKIIGRDLDDERLFRRISGYAGTGGQADLRQLNRVKNAVSADTWNEIQSAIIADMGRSPDGSFSPAKFVTAYGKMSGSGKGALFGSRRTNPTRQALDDISRVSKQFGSVREFQNPPGTAQNVLAGLGLLGAGQILDLGTLAGTAAGVYGLSTLLGRPTAARSVGAWSRAVENYVKNPTREAGRILQRRSQALVPFVSMELGENAQASEQGEGAPEQGQTDQPLVDGAARYDPRYDA